jgi:hypothetical protein
VADASRNATLTLTEESFSPEGANFDLTFTMKRAASNIASSCSVVVTKAFGGEEQDALHMTVSSASTSFSTDRSHTFTCSQDRVPADELEYNWEIIDIFKSASMEGIELRQDGSTLTVPKDTFKYNRSYQVMCSAQSADHAGHGSLRIKTPKQYSKVNLEVEPATFGVAGITQFTFSASKDLQSTDLPLFCEFFQRHNG